MQTARPMTILLVEDEAAIALGIEAELSDFGLGVDIAISCADARAYIDANAPAYRACVIDIGLPDGRGDVLADEIRRCWPGIPLVICTGYDNDVVRCSARDRGRFRMVGKPCTGKAIEAAILEAEAEPMRED